jgi:molecular chaperone GrpE (heat shock protein)
METLMKIWMILSWPRKNAVEAVKKLKEKLKKSEAERLEYLTGWQRSKADLINARKRDETDRQEFTKYANENLISELISVLDSFDMAIGNKEAWKKPIRIGELASSISTRN